MADVVQPSDCVRAREDASARLDGELSELDAARLRAHVQQCAECRAFAEEIERVAALLRGAPLERPAIGSCRGESQAVRLGGDGFAVAALSHEPRKIRLAALVAAVAVTVAAAAAAASRAPTQAVRFVPHGAFAQLDADRIPPAQRFVQRERSLFVAT